VKLLVAVQVYAPQVVVSVFSAIPSRFDVVGGQFLPIAEAFFAYLTYIFLVLGTPLFAGDTVLDLRLVPFLPVSPQTWGIWGVGALAR
jgi:hypothetical protein